MSNTNFVVTDPDEMRVLCIALAFAFAAVQEGCEAHAEMLFEEFLNLAHASDPDKMNNLMERIALTGAEMSGAKVFRMPHPSRSRLN